MLMKSDWKTRLRSRMREIGVTQSELAENIGTTQGHIANYLSGRNRLKLDHIIAICTTLDMSADWLLFGKIQNKPMVINKEDARAIKRLASLPENIREPIIDLVKSLNNTIKVGNHVD